MRILRRQDRSGTARAETRGVYVLHGKRFVINAGDPIPEGATVETGFDKPSERATEPKAPKAGGQKAATGPEETT